MRANVNPQSIIFTDDWRPYRQVGLEFAGHRIINHSAGAYVVGDIHTNTIEGFFGNMKKADAAKREATEDLPRYCEAVREAGVSITQIASEAGLSRQD